MCTILDLASQSLGKAFLDYTHILGGGEKTEPNWVFKMYEIGDSGMLHFSFPHRTNEHWAFHCYCPAVWKEMYPDGSCVTMHEILKNASRDTQDQLVRMKSDQVDRQIPPYVGIDDINTIIVPIGVCGRVDLLKILDTWKAILNTPLPL